MRPSLIIPRIRSQVAAFANRVASTAEFASAQSSIEDVAVPAAFVVPLAESVTENQSMPLVTQFMDDQFGVIIVVDNSVDNRGQAGAEQLSDLRDGLLTALIGWRPTAVYMPITYQGSEHLALDAARLWHQFNFGAKRIIQQA